MCVCVCVCVRARVCVSLSLDYSVCVCVSICAHTRTKALRATNEGRERRVGEDRKKENRNDVQKCAKFWFPPFASPFFFSRLSLSSGLVLLPCLTPRYNFVLIYEKRLSLFSHIKYVREKKENAVYIKSVFIHYGRVRVGDFPRGAFEFVVDAGGRCVFERRRWCDFFVFFFSRKFFFEITRFFLEKTGKLSNTKGTQNEVVRESTRVESKIESSVRRSVFYSGRIQIRVVSRVRRRRSFA